MTSDVVPRVSSNTVAVLNTSFWQRVMRARSRITPIGLHRSWSWERIQDLATARPEIKSALDKYRNSWGFQLWWCDPGYGGHFSGQPALCTIQLDIMH